MLAQFKNSVRRFHRDEDGIEAVQVVMIVAIAAVVLITLLKFGDFIFGVAKDKVNAMKDADMTATF